MSTSIGTAAPHQATVWEHLHLPAHSHHRHNGALDPHVVSCGALAPRCEALNLSSESHLPTNASCRSTPR